MQYECRKVMFVHVIICVISEHCFVVFNLSHFHIYSSHCLNKVNKLLKYMNELFDFHF